MDILGVISRGLDLGSPGLFLLTKAGCCHWNIRGSPQCLCWRIGTVLSRLVASATFLTVSV